MRNVSKISVGNLNENGHFGELGIGERIILGWILRK
jgi:hypothetical protein